MKREEVRERLENQAEQSYKEFNDKIVPGVKNAIGVRLPALRKLAKEMAKEDYKEYFDELEHTEKASLYHEELLLQGILIGIIKVTPSERMEYIKKFVFKIDNWAVCDTFCSGLKFTKDNGPLMWEFIQPYLTDEREFFVRFGVVMLMCYYIDEEHIERDIEILEGIQQEGYYTKMAVAWALSLCYVKFPEITRSFFEKSNNKLDDFAYNKAIQKIKESYRVTKEEKAYLHSLKRK
ncbi:DNA alkylation repair protein [Clostridium aminobutyricum]|uniref:DNA alkylation repair protein n=1 Tax=Clostridium aminobutyricum TaxID=33953 RepID=A0A939D8S0_CLOAM|nr:DNA alkylation repair protein [Clostridium aminobutyricum]MBN7773312.1 DNA alkylation repair protein [Clostridium aminobutyricum]